MTDCHDRIQIGGSSLIECDSTDAPHPGRGHGGTYQADDGRDVRITWGSMIEHEARMAKVRRDHALADQVLGPLHEQWRRKHPNLEGIDQ